MNERLLQLDAQLDEAIEFAQGWHKAVRTGNVGFNKDGSLYHKDTGETIIDKHGRLVKKNA
tara:strand:- start:1011 stop:1193 length:183 start_codon:yes stop_codon:yes gene_type:complete